MYFRTGARSTKPKYDGKHRLEHWYRDNTVYFLTVRCAEKYHAFVSESAKQIFWRQFDKYTTEHGFELWICTLLDNHYHAIGFLSDGKQLSPMLRKIHGSVSKLVNDILPNRRRPFWSDYFDGCLRDETQFRRAYRYTQLQSVRHGICKDWHDYPHTRVLVSIEDGLNTAQEQNGFMNKVPYQRYHQ